MKSMKHVISNSDLFLDQDKFNLFLLFTVRRHSLNRISISSVIAKHVSMIEARITNSVFIFKHLFTIRQYFRLTNISFNSEV